MLSGSKVLPTFSVSLIELSQVSNLIFWIPGLLSASNELHFNVSNILKIDFYKTHTLKLLQEEKGKLNKNKIT